MKKISLLVAVFYLSVLGYAQSEQAATKELKNTIRWNPTTMVFNAANFTLGYERVLKNSQSFSINIGFFKLPELIAEDNQYLSLEKQGGKIGFTLTADYRFYLKKYNARPAPSGVYIGPYFAHYNYNFDNTIIVNDNGDFTANVGVDAGFNMTSIGFELGYQFVFWKRLSLDLILAGPSLSFYNGKINVNGDLELDEESDAYAYLHDKILDKYPWLETFINLDAINSGGSFNATAVGFRYVIQIGFRF
jgi:hypothetical protein